MDEFVRLYFERRRAGWRPDRAAAWGMSTGAYTLYLSKLSRRA